MSGQIVIIISLLLLVTVLIVVIFYNKKDIIKRKLKKAPITKIQDFKTGQTARITGRIECVDKLLIAPLSNRKCAHYYVHIQQYVSNGKSGHWKTLIEEVVSNKFVLKEVDKYAYINDTNINSYIVQDRQYRSGYGKDATDVLMAYLKQHGHESENFLGFNKKIRYKEGVLEPGELTAVLGKGEWKDAEAVGLPYKYGKILLITAPENGKIYLSDDPDTVVV